VPGGYFINGDRDMSVKIELREAVLIAGRHCDAGEIIEVDALLAQRLVGAGRAIKALTESKGQGGSSAPVENGKQVRAPGLNTSNSAGLTKR